MLPVGVALARVVKQAPIHRWAVLSTLWVALIYADFLSDDVDLATLRFTQEDVELLRRKIVLELVVERETPGTGPPCKYHLLVREGPLSFVLQ
jgi:hypothetical protein